jgi:hypothetical protein
MSTPGLQPQTAGWYPDPAGSGGQRWHDGQGWTGQVSMGITKAPLGPGFARLGDWLGRLLGVWGVLYLVLAAVPTWLWLNPPHPDLPTQPTQAAPPATPASGQLDGAPAAMWVALAICGLSLLTGVLWLIWQYQLAEAAPVALRRSPGSHVWWWFVPFANWWIPRSNIGNLWHAYGHQRRGEVGDPTPVVFSLWWTLWLAPLLLEPFFVLGLLRASSVDAAVRSVFLYWAASLVAGGLAAFAARVVVRELSWRALVFWSQVV